MSDDSEFRELLEEIYSEWQLEVCSPECSHTQCVRRNELNIRVRKALGWVDE